jgi:hypothetical protein
MSRQECFLVFVNDSGGVLLSPFCKLVGKNVSQITLAAFRPLGPVIDHFPGSRRKSPASKEALSLKLDSPGQRLPHAFRTTGPHIAIERKFSIKQLTTTFTK